jgi:hypothetical protein
MEAGGIFFGKRLLEHINLLRLKKAGRKSIFFDFMPGIG